MGAGARIGVDGPMTGGGGLTAIPWPAWSRSCSPEAINASSGTSNSGVICTSMIRSSRDSNGHNVSETKSNGGI